MLPFLGLGRPIEAAASARGQELGASTGRPHRLSKALDGEDRTRILSGKRRTDPVEEKLLRDGGRAFTARTKRSLGLRNSLLNWKGANGESRNNHSAGSGISFAAGFACLNLASQSRSPSR